MGQDTWLPAFAVMDDPKNFTAFLGLGVLSCKMAEEGRYRGSKGLHPMNQ